MLIERGVLLEKDDIVSSIILELRRGTLILSVLSQLDHQMYGYNLVTLLSEKGISIEANTLYPLLRRLESQGILLSKWDTQESSKPRKYYIRTDLGDEIYEIIKAQWINTIKTMNSLLTKEES